MININILQINVSTNTLDVSVETSVGHTINSAILWTEDTFKDYNKSISLNNYLTGINNKEVFSVPISTVNRTNPTGMYFVEFTTTDTAVSNCSDCDGVRALGFTADLSNYEECLLDTLLEIQYETSDVVNNLQLGEAINVSTLLEAICISIKFGYYQEAIDKLNDIKVLCSNKQECTTCASLSTPSFKTGLNFGVFNNNLILQ